MGFWPNSTDSLDFQAGDGKIPRELGRLYDYMMRRLLAANAQVADEPLAEVLDLLCSLLSAWEQIAASPAPARKSFPPENSFSGADLARNLSESRYSMSF